MSAFTFPAHNRVPESWQAAILEHEIRTLEQQHRPPPPGPVKCLPPLLADLEELKHLRDLLVELPPAMVPKE